MKKIRNTSKLLHTILNTAKVLEQEINNSAKTAGLTAHADKIALTLTSLIREILKQAQKV